MTNQGPVRIHRPTAFEELRYGYFDTAFDNMLKSIIGGTNAIGTMTLAMCAVSAFSEIEWAFNNQTQLESNGELMPMNFTQRQALGYLDREKFMGWLQRWVKETGINPDCEPERTYGIRCALVHTAGDASALTTTGVKAWNITTASSADHNKLTQRLNDVERFNLDMPQFLAELILGADIFLNHHKLMLESASPTLCLRIAFLGGPLSADLSSRSINNAGSLAWVDERLSASPLQIPKEELASIVKSLCENAVKAGLVFQHRLKP